MESLRMNPKRARNNIISSKIRNLELQHSKLKCTDDELIMQPDEKIDACRTFAQRTEEKNRRIYDSVLTYVEEQANMNVRIFELENNFTQLQEVKPADINEVSFFSL